LEELKINYASELNGGKIVLNETSHGYSNLVFRNSAIKMLNDSFLPGECWGFVGDKAFVTV
jgi:hypothetical protein